MKSVDSFIDGLPENKAAIVERLRQILYEQVPAIEERLSFKVPFYHYFGMFCYINPTRDGVDLVFCRGKDLLDEFSQLEDKGRAIMASVGLKEVRDIERLRVRELVTVAAIWNEEAKKKGVPMVLKSGKRILKRESRRKR